MIENQEIWKDIKGFEGYYQVSNLGRVKSLPRLRRNCYGINSIVREKIMKGKKDRDGYIVHGLCKNGKTKSYTLHRLVAYGFLENSNPLFNNQINHKDGNKLNNIPENLEWCDCTYNNREAVRLGLKGGRPYKVRIDAKPFLQIFQGVIINEFPSLAEATRTTGIRKTAISNCLRKRSKSCSGYEWVYK